jgi:hypothetical protein
MSAPTENAVVECGGCGDVVACDDDLFVGYCANC